MASTSNYYQDNISYIGESIPEESMNYAHSRSAIPQQISEDISVSRTNQRASISAASKSKIGKHRPPPPPAPKPSEPPVVHETITEQSVASATSDHHNQPDEYQVDRPVNLGPTVALTVQDRYFEMNKVSTHNPDVLYDFYLLQRKNTKKRTDKAIKKDEAALEVMIPSARRKQQNKLDFEKVLREKPTDVLYTLTVAAHAQLKDKELRKNENILNTQMARTHKNNKSSDPKARERLYKSSRNTGFGGTKAEKERLERIRLHEFGRKLSETYQRAMGQDSQKRVESLSKIYRFWQELYDKEDYGLEWDDQTAQSSIRQYMIEQVKELKRQFTKKVGYEKAKGNDLLKFLWQNPQLQGVFIPPHSFVEYAQVYSLNEQEKQEEYERAQEKLAAKHQNKKKKADVKQFGRPVSATPLDILSQPKVVNDCTDLFTKYKQDKVLKGMMRQELLKAHRPAYQYGVYDMVEELKVKNRVRPNKTEDYDHTITRMLNKSIVSNQSFFEPTSSRDRVGDMLREENLSRDENWTHMTPLLQEAILIKCHEEKWFRDPLVKYVQKVAEIDLSFEDNKKVVKEVLKYLTELYESDREQELEKLERFINISKQIEDKNSQVKGLEKKDEKYYLKQRRLMYADLVERAILLLTKQRQIRQKRTDEKLNRRQFMQETYRLLMKDHKDAVKKYFCVVEVKGEKDCPKLLKYEFYRLLKEINPFTCQRDDIIRAPAWVPTKTQPESFNYKTYNTYGKVYSKDTRKMICDPQPQQRSESLWGRRHGKQRQKLMMTYDDAKECYFHPRGKKMD